MPSATGSSCCGTTPPRFCPAASVFYDLFRGITRHVLCYPNAAEAELPRAQGILKDLSPGTLLLGDRLYASIQYFHHPARLKLKRLKRFSSQQGHGSFLEDGLVEAGCGVGPPTLTLRLIRYRGRWRRQEVIVWMALN